MSAPQAPPSFAALYAENAAFVWRSLKQLGVREGDAADACQEAFLVVHKKLGDFRGGSARSWLFAIAVRVASDYRKRARHKREILEDAPDEPVPEAQTKEVEEARARKLLQDILASLDDDKRAVFVAFELEELPMAEVA